MLVVGCAARTAPEPEPASTVFLSPTEHLVRASMALRGIRPSIDDLRAVDADPGQLDKIVDGYLASPAFAATVRELHNEVFLLRTQRAELTTPAMPPIATASFDEISSSMYDEPLRLIEDVVMSGQPYTHIVTTDYTMADPIAAAVWGLPHSDQPGWERTTWSDGRPAAGILSSSALYVRWRSAAANFNRGRANMIARALLCDDFLAGDVKLDTKVDLADPNVVATAVVENPSCAACHQTLDPLASYFFGFTQGPVNGSISAYPFEMYNASQEAMWLFTNGRPPMYFGQDVHGLAALGQAIASDPRFAKCAATHFASYLTEVPASELSPTWIAQLQDDFTAARYDARQLAKEIVLSDAFRISHSDDLVAAEGIVGYQKARPAQLGRMLEDLTGYRWTADSNALVNNAWRVGPIDYLDDDYSGYRVLGGGIDSFYVNEPVHTMSTTAVMVARRAAWKAASFVVIHDALAPPGMRTLFAAAPVTATDDASVRAELAYLHARIFGELDADVEPTLALFHGALAASPGDPRRAWTVTLTGMLSDLRAVYY